MSVTINGTTGVSKVNDPAVVYDSELAGQVAPQLVGFKNHLINGGFDVQQRGTSFTNTTGGKTYTVDRWSTYYYDTASNVSINVQVGEVSPNAVKIGRVNGSAVTSQVWLVQAIESVNIKKLKGKTMTLSFWAKKGVGLTGSPVITIRQGTGTDESWDVGYTGAATTNQGITLTTSLQKFTYTFTVGATTNEMAVGINIAGFVGVASDDYIVVEQMQLEEGSVATPFEQRPYGLELSLCQRYYEKWESPGTLLAMNYNTTSGVSNLVKFNTSKRVVPSCTITVSPTYAGNTGTLSSVVVSQASVSEMAFGYVISGGTAWSPTNLNGGTVTISAEL